MKRSLLAVALAGGCAAQPHDGLELETHESTRVAGTFAQDGVAFAFEFQHTGDRYVMAFHDVDGNPLLTTTLEGRQQTTRVLGDRLVLSGITNAPDPTIEGDPEVMQELLARPEAKLQEGLRDALVAATEIDPALYDPKPVAEDPDLGGQGLQNYDGRYYAFSPGDWNYWLTAGGASPTYVYVKNPWPTNGACAAVNLWPWSTPWPEDNIVVDPWTPNYKTLYWWGSMMGVYNYGYKTTWYGYKQCLPAVVLVRVSPYWWSP